jgi:hypothetical protein
MAGYYRYTAVLDACVLYPAPLRDLLVSLAVDGIYGARWTAEIHDEWIRNLVENYQYLTPTLELPDPGDRHVLAAAIVGHADANIATLEQQGLPQTCRILRDAIGLI